MRTYVGIGIIILFNAVGCVERSGGPGRIERQFIVDRSLLAEPVRDTVLKISFMPPKGWTAIPESVLAAAVEESGASEKIVTGFAHGYNDSGGGVITISQIPNFDRSDSSTTMQKFKMTIAKGDPQADVQLTCYYHQGWKIHQLFTQSSGFAVYKMIYSQNAVPFPVQFDYAFPVEHNQATMTKIVESVAGSVTLFTKK